MPLQLDCEPEIWTREVAGAVRCCMVRLQVAVCGRAASEAQVPVESCR